MNSVLLLQFFVGQVLRRSGHNSYTDIKVSLSDSTVKKWTNTYVCSYSTLDLDQALIHQACLHLLQSSKTNHACRV